MLKKTCGKSSVRQKFVSLALLPVGRVRVIFLRETGDSLLKEYSD
jgi:hypothetical protein